jgi:hypothetical protein
MFFKRKWEQAPALSLPCFAEEETLTTAFLPPAKGREGVEVEPGALINLLIL